MVEGPAAATEYREDIAAEEQKGTAEQRRRGGGNYQRMAQDRFRPSKVASTDRPRDGARDAAADRAGGQHRHQHQHWKDEGGPR